MPSRDVASNGGLERMRLYGNPGTKDGRRKGGLNSIKSHKSAKDGFKLRKKIKVPRHSLELAELLGIYMGDGHLSQYQGSVVTNSLTDVEHAEFIKDLQEKLFEIEVSIRKKKTSNALTILVSSREVCLYLSSQGMPIGNKLKGGMVVPSWILKKSTFEKAFLRGLIDTDGCVYTDTHKGKNVIYQSVCVAFTNTSVELTDFVYSFFLKEGYRPTRSKRDVRLRRKGDVARYVREVGFSNPKHARKIKV